MPGDRDFITGPPIGPEALALAGGMPTDGGKELRYDSSALRSQWEGTGTPVPDAGYNPGALEQQIPPEILEAMRRGAPPPMAAMPYNPPPGMPPIAQFAQPHPEFDMVLPLGDGVVARIVFTGEPGVKQWKRLLRHLLIEAEEEGETNEVSRTGLLDGEHNAPANVRRRTGKPQADGP
jgi:hypothetical protein